MAGPRGYDSTVKIVTDIAAADEVVYLDPASIQALPPVTPTTNGLMTPAMLALLGLTSNQFVKTANYTLVPNELVRGDATLGGFTFLLPTAPPDGTLEGMKKTDLSANPITWHCGGSDVINKTAGATSGTLSLPGQAVMVQYQATGGIWIVVGDDLPLAQLDARFASLAIPATPLVNGSFSAVDKLKLDRVTPALTKALGGDGYFITGTGADDLNGLAVPAQGAVAPVSYTTSGFNEHPTNCIMPDGVGFVAHRFVTSGGSDTTGQGFIGLRKTTDFVTFAPAFTAVPTNIASDATYDCRGPNLMVMADGRVLLTFTVNPAAGGNPSGLITGPDSLVGNIRGCIGVYNTNTQAITWGSIFTIPTGFAGFDVGNHGRTIEPVAGSIVVPFAGSPSASTFDDNETIAYVVGTYVAGTGGITWSTKYKICDKDTGGANTLQNLISAEPVIVVCANGDWLCLYRSKSTNGALYSTRLVGGTNGLAGTGTWTQPAVAFANLTTQPNMWKGASGRIVFVSRGSNALPNHVLVQSSVDNGTTWSPVDDANHYAHADRRWSMGGYSYGAVCELPWAPGMYWWVGAVNYAAPVATTTVISRFFSEAAGVTPHGHVVGRGFTSIDEDVYTPAVMFAANGAAIRLGANHSTVDTNSTNSYQRNTGDMDLLPKSPAVGPGATPSVKIWEGFKTAVTAGKGFLDAFYLRRPPEDTKPANATFSNFGREHAHDILSILTTQQLMCAQVVPVRAVANSTKVRIYFDPSNLGATITNAWVVITNTSGVKIQISTDLGAVGSVAAAQDFTIPSSNFSTTAGVYVCLMVKGGTMPRPLGLNQIAGPSGDGLALCGSSSYLSGSLTNPASFTGPMSPMPAGGTGWMYVEFRP